MLSQESQPESITQMLSFPNDSYTIRSAFLIRIQRIYFHLNRVKTNEDIKQMLYIEQVAKSRAGPGPRSSGPAHGQSITNASLVTLALSLHRNLYSHLKIHIYTPPMAASNSMLVTKCLHPHPFDSEVKITYLKAPSTLSPR